MTNTRATMTNTKQTVPAAPTTPNTTPTVKLTKTPHEEVATLVDDAVVCVITKRIFNNLPRYSFSFFKEYDAKGETKRSHWFEKRHTDSIRKLTDQAEQWIEKVEDKERSTRRTR